MRKGFAVAFACLLLIAGAARCDAGAYDATAAVAREAVWKALTNGEGSSATVAVMDGGNIVYSECFGAADRETGRPVRSDTRFNIGSTSKMFAAVAILLLADDGRLSLDDPVAKHLPEFAMRDGRYRDITVRMLFNHSSGIPGSTFLFEYEPGYDPHELLLDVLRDSDLKHSPGAMGIYCNDGFTLAEMIVERLSGKKFVDFVAERIYEPLEMKHSAASVGEAGGDVAVYYDIPTGKRYPLEVVQVHGAGGLSSTAEDLCRFGDSFAPGGKHILGDAMLEEALKSQPTAFTKHLNAAPMLDAFGWDYAWIPAYRDRGVQALGKSGGTMFYSTNLLVVPAERIVVAASITGRADAPGITRAILDALMKEKGLPFPAKPALEKPCDGEPIPSDLFAYEGVYADASRAVRLAFDREKNTLNIHHLLPAPLEGEQLPPPVVLTYCGGLFRDFEKGTSYYFVSDGDDVYLMHENIPGYGMNALAFQRLKELESPKQLSIDMNGVLWMVRNMLPQAQILRGMLMWRSSTCLDLPGYVFCFGLQRVEDFGYASIAATAFRDQMALRLFRKDGGIRAQNGFFTLSRADEAKELAEGANTVVIGPNGENEWRRVGHTMILTFDRPEKGRVLAVDPNEDAALLYDSVVDDGEFLAPGGTYIFCAGAPGDEFGLEAR